MKINDRYIDRQTGELHQIVSVEKTEICTRLLNRIGTLMIWDRKNFIRKLSNLNSDLVRKKLGLV